MDLDKKNNSKVARQVLFACSWTVWHFVTDRPNELEGERRRTMWKLYWEKKQGIGPCSNGNG